MSISLTLIEFLGIGGFFLGIINLILLWIKYRKDKPMIEIRKNIYKKCLRLEGLNDKEYSEAVDKAVRENPEVFGYEIRNLIVEIINSGHRDAKLKKIRVWYKEKGKNNFFPKVINFFPRQSVQETENQCIYFLNFQKK